MATAVVAGAVAAAAISPPPPKVTALSLVRRCVELLRGQFVVVLMVYAVKDAAAFLLHRVTQRLTNHAAEVLLSAPTSSAGNPWWLLLDPAFIRAHPGYELLIALFFVACLPLSIALNSAAFTAASLICTRPPAADGAEGGGADGAAGGKAAAAAAFMRGPLPLEGDPALAELGITPLGLGLGRGGPPPPAVAPHSPMPPPRMPAEGSTGDASAASAAAAALAAAPLTGTGDAAAAAAEAAAKKPGGFWTTLKAAVRALAGVWSDVAAALRRVWWVDVNVNVRALPLQGLCLLVLPAPWALPRLLGLQASLPVAVLEGKQGTEALDRSRALLSGSLTAFGLPFTALLGAGRLVEYVQGLALALIPPRWWRDVVEVPLAIALGFVLIKAVAARLQDLLPLAAYLQLTEAEAEAARRAKEEATAAAAEAAASAAAA